jgi:hypothetical protein
MALRKTRTRLSISSRCTARRVETDSELSPFSPRAQRPSPHPRVHFMHVFPSNQVPILSQVGERGLGVPVTGNRRALAALAGDKSFIARWLVETSMSSRRSEQVSFGRFSTPDSAFSTHRAPSVQLRDVHFVSRCSTSSYITTGVESRSFIRCRPAVPSAAKRTEAARVLRRPSHTWLSPAAWPG